MRIHFFTAPFTDKSADNAKESGLSLISLLPVFTDLEHE